LVEAFPLERCIADGQHLIDHEDLGLQVSSHGERQSHVHPAAIPFHWRVKEPLYLGEAHDLVELPPDLEAAHSEDCAIEIDVLSTSQLGAAPGSHPPHV